LIKLYYKRLFLIVGFIFYVFPVKCFAQNIDTLFYEKQKLKRHQKLAVEGHSFLYGLLRSGSYIKKYNNPVLEAPAVLKDYFYKQKEQIKQLPKPNYSDSSEIKLAIVGDIMWLRNNWGNFMDSAVYVKLNESDLIIGNLETIIDTTKKVKSFLPDYRTYNSNKQLLNFLPAKRSILSVANNHSLDKGILSLYNTLTLLESKGIYHNGVKNNTPKLYTEIIIKGIKIGFYACTWGTNNPKAKGIKQLNLIKGIAPFNYNTIEEQEAEKALKQMEEAGMDFKILFMHWGYEYEFYPRQNIMKLAKNLAQAGADFIIGSHPHVFQPAQIIYTINDSFNSKHKTTLVNYSLGNFCTSMYSTETRLGVIEQISLKKESNGKISITCPQYTFLYNAPHIGKRERKLLLLSDYIKLYPKEANEEFIKTIKPILNILE